MTLQRRTIPVPSMVTVSRRGPHLVVAGPLGRCGMNLHALDPQGLCALRVDAQGVHLATPSRALAGVLEASIRQRLQGVTRGYLRRLQVHGIGYRVRCEGPLVLLKLGYSHDVVYRVPDALRLYVMDGTTLCLFGVDYEHVTHVARQLCTLRPSSIYHRKGIRPVTDALPRG
jgi:large subunit ribosomal protein L6